MVCEVRGSGGRRTREAWSVRRIFFKQKPLVERLEVADFRA
jgi:hypothetical protein